MFYFEQYPGESDLRWQRRVRRKYDDLPEAYFLRRVKWQIFGHLTFVGGIGSGRKLCRKIRRDMFHATLRQAADTAKGCRFPSFWIAARWEKGTRDDLHPHIHFLIARIPKHVDLDRFAFECGRLWRAFGGGLEKIERYDRRLDGAGYIAKAPKIGADEDDGDCGLTFSNSLVKYLTRLAQERVI